MITEEQYKEALNIIEQYKKKLDIVVVNGSFEKAQKEFGLVLEYSESNGKKYLEIYSQGGKSKWAEWCKYADGSINLR